MTDTRQETEQPPEEDLQNALQILAAGEEPPTACETEAVLKLLESAYRKVRRGLFA